MAITKSYIKKKSAIVTILVAIAVAILLVAIVTTIVAMAFQSYSRQSNDIQAKDNLQEMNTLIDQFALDIDNGNVTFDNSATIVGNQLTVGTAQYTVESVTIYNLLTDGAINVLPLSRIATTAPNDTYIVYSTISGSGEDRVISLHCIDIIRLEQLNRSSAIEGIVLFANTLPHRLLYSTAYYTDNLQSYTDGNSQDGDTILVNTFDNDTIEMTVGTNSSLSCMVGVFANKTEYYNTLSQGRTYIIVANAVLALLFAALLVVALVVAFNQGAKSGGAKYIIEVDSRGIIVGRNRRFAQDFAAIRTVKEKLVYYSDSETGVISIVKDGEACMLSCRVEHTPKGTTRLFCNILQSPYRKDEMFAEVEDTVKSTYNKVINNKKVLVGVFRFNNIDNLSAMFGNEFADRLYSIIKDKIAGKFEHTWDYEKYQVAVLDSDAKTIDRTIADMDEILSYLNRPVKLHRNTVLLGVVAGFALCDNSMTDKSYEAVIEAIDATHKRLDNEKDKLYYIYHNSQRKLYEKYFLKYDIRAMLADNMFELQYQPQLSLDTNKIVGFEALFRVKNQVYNVSIFDLIQHAERTGNMIMLGEFIFDTGMQFAKLLEDTGIKLSLNVSPVQLMQAGFVENFLSIYNKYNLKPNSICLEITESFLMTTFEETLRKLEILKNNGIDIHLDDFGTQYSSLQYLKLLPIAAIKIDKIFINDVVNNNVSSSIVGMIVTLCRQLQLDCIAEGVEDIAQYHKLKEIGCDIIQGYLVGKAMPQDSALNMIGKSVIEEEN